MPIPLVSVLDSAAPAKVRVRGAIAGFIIGLLSGGGIVVAPPAFVQGEEPAGAPDGACVVVKTGVLQGQRVCDAAAMVGAGEHGHPGGLAAEDCQWTCTDTLADGGCALMDCVSPAPAPPSSLGLDPWNKPQPVAPAGLP